jgi:hypothetical protein
MTRRIFSRGALATGLIATILVFAGCFGTKFTLIDPAKAHVDRVYVGDWEALNPKGDAASLVIRNLDDKLLYVELREAEKASRYVGFTTDVAGVTFAHVRPLTDNGDIPDTWLLMRLNLGSDQRTLTILQLKDEFFKDKKVETPEQLRAVLAQNINDQAMYDKDEQITATRGGGAAAAVPK